MQLNLMKYMSWSTVIPSGQENVDDYKAIAKLDQENVEVKETIPHREDLNPVRGDGVSFGPGGSIPLGVITAVSNTLITGTVMHYSGTIENASQAGISATLNYVNPHTSYINGITAKVFARALLPTAVAATATVATTVSGGFFTFVVAAGYALYNHHAEKKSIQDRKDTIENFSTVYDEITFNEDEEGNIILDAQYLETQERSDGIQMKAPQELPSKPKLVKEESGVKADKQEHAKAKLARKLNKKVKTARKAHSKAQEKIMSADKANQKAERYAKTLKQRVSKNNGSNAIFSVVSQNGLRNRLKNLAPC